ncbi:hypothetical protein [Shimia sp.]|uniref:hypothetical protein n=1 Tax=unclassified Shimia TaxID=2630038 RepID=UPI0025E61DCF|nr:hypothetical protein [Shimia sp.]MCH2067524.1 hypothetical protein [Shimia sp.]
MPGADTGKAHDRFLLGNDGAGGLQGARAKFRRRLCDQFMAMSSGAEVESLRDATVPTGTLDALGHGYLETI